MWRSATKFCCLEISAVSQVDVFIDLVNFSLSFDFGPNADSLHRRPVVIKQCSGSRICMQMGSHQPPTLPPCPTKVSTSTPAKLTIKAAVLVGDPGTDKGFIHSGVWCGEDGGEVDFSATLWLFESRRLTIELGCIHQRKLSLTILPQNTKGARGFL